MKLFLAAQAKDPTAFAKFQEFVGRDFRDLSIVYIPTAANGVGWGSWKGGESFKLAQSLGAHLTALELESVGAHDIRDVIGTPDIIWVGGGMTGYLMYWIRRTRLDSILPELLKAGSIYLGSSAGSMVCSTTNYVSDDFPGEEEPGSSLLTGLGYIDFEIFPHYDETIQHHRDYVHNWNKGPLCLLKNDEAITMVDGKITFLGERRMINEHTQ